MNLYTSAYFLLIGGLVSSRSVEAKLVDTFCTAAACHQWPETVQEDIDGLEMLQVRSQKVGKTSDDPPSPLQFLVDNSKLKSASDGMNFYKSDSRVQWGTIVQGVYSDDRNWVIVNSTMYLPRFVNGIQVLEKKDFPKCQDNLGGNNYCSEWCNTPDKWTCGIATNNDYTCDCEGCNGCGQVDSPWACHKYTDGQDDDWCASRHGKIHDGFEYTYLGQENHVCGCWCCKRGVDIEDTIPKIIHHTYKEDLSQENASFPALVWRVAYESWKTKFPAPTYKHMFWTDDALRKCLDEEFPNFVQAYERMNGSIMASDAGRYCILHKVGGIYGDLDYEVLHDFYWTLPPGKVSLIESPYAENEDTTYQLQNALMASPAKHPLWEKVIAFMLVEDDDQSWKSEHGTGPRMISRMAEIYPEDVHVLPCSQFQRLRKFQDCGDPNDFDVSAGIHWNSQSYAEEQSFISLKLHDHNWRDETFWKLHPELKGRRLYDKA